MGGSTLTPHALKKLMCREAKIKSSLLLELSDSTKVEAKDSVREIDRLVAFSSVLPFFSNVPCFGGVLLGVLFIGFHWIRRWRMMQSVMDGVFPPPSVFDNIQRRLCHLHRAATACRALPSCPPWPHQPLRSSLDGW